MINENILIVLISTIVFICIVVLIIRLIQNNKKIKSLENTITRIHKKLQTLEEKIVHQSNNITRIEKEKTVLEEQYMKKKDDFDALEQESREARGAKNKLDLVSAILGAKLPSNDGLIEFKRLLREDFFNFANEESSVAEEAACVLKLQNIEKELELMSNYSAIIGKTRIAVAGGFSSGKSSFLNGIIPDTNIKLPVGVNPVTAIPTYIISQQSESADTTITAFSTKGGNTPISSEIYNKLSHDFINSLGFNLKDILAFMAITISEKIYEHICFIDTPGYNPGSSGESTHSDTKTASEFVEQSDIVLWCIDIERGTVPKTDLEFIREHLQEKTLYIVMSKADIKSTEEIEDILDEVEEMLHDEDIAIEGISACSFLNGIEEKTSRKMNIDDFLTLYNKNSTKHEKETLIARVEEVCDIYDKAINESIKFSKEHQKELHSIGA